MIVEYSDAITDMMLNAPRQAVLLAGGVAFGSTDRMSTINVCGCGQPVAPPKVKCRECKAAVQREYLRRYAQTSEGRARKRASDAAYRERHRAELAERDAAYRASKPESEKARWTREADSPKGQARQAVRHAVKRGDLIKPDTCPECGRKAILHGHHHRGYDHPLDVLWLCSYCHGLEHRKDAA